MKIEKLNDNQIRCTLTRADLVDRQIKLSELICGGDKAFKAEGCAGVALKIAAHLFPPITERKNGSAGVADISGNSALHMISHDECFFNLFTEKQRHDFCLMLNNICLA